MSCAACGDTLVVTRWRHAGYDKSPVKESVSCPLCCSDPDISSMTETQLTLHLARQGISPEDTRRGLNKALEKIRVAKSR